MPGFLSALGQTGIIALAVVVVVVLLIAAPLLYIAVLRRSDSVFRRVITLIRTVRPTRRRRGR